MISNTSYLPAPSKQQKIWFLIDAEDQVLGRVASEIAKTLSGKNEKTFTPFFDCGNYVIVINAEKIRVSGQKYNKKLYKRHSGRPGGMKVETFSSLQNRIPERIIEKAVKGMLPKGPLGRSMFRKLKVYQGPNHPHTVQDPNQLGIIKKL